MINYFSTNAFSNVDFTKALELIGVKGGYVRAKLVKSVYSVVYTVWSDAYQKWLKGCTFVSISVLLKAKYLNTCDRARRVEFIANHAGKFETSTHHLTTVQTCTCPAFTGKYTKMFQFKINGNVVCKHQIALAKRVLGINKISDYLALRSV